MLPSQKLQSFIGLILLIGTSLASCMVALGSLWFLWQHGADPLPAAIFHYVPIHLNVTAVWQVKFSALGLIQLGLLFLVLTQLLRVLLLCCFYISAHDDGFVLISSFVLLVLIYSNFCR